MTYNPYLSIRFPAWIPLMRLFSGICLVAIGLFSPWIAASTHAQVPRPIEFNRDVRPILSDACFQCHGPDKAKRKASLHFDVKAGAGEVIVPGKPEESELVKRITSLDKTKRMPPASSAHTLTDRKSTRLNSSH